MDIIIQLLADHGMVLPGFTQLLLYAFFGMMVLDILSGWGSALYNRNMDSQVAYKGYIRKGGLVIGVAMAFLVDLILGIGFPMFTSGVIIYLGCTEALSITENLSKMNVPMPKGITERLRQTIEHQERVGLTSEVKTDSEGKTVITNTVEIPPEQQPPKE